ncbi:peptidase family M41-domain-containing protein [Rhypophila decipiens]|uniref:Peptidase family M41-domain-containing protein n=1 Tax=Rhypophila decipiens TaxID=261697 RepID=A0AAN6Y4W6_9PEZI|nr:peptidase family M41-domain-containing protein [Rhypophila decipiens]
MALQSSGLPTIAAATADLWPSIANSLIVPWRTAPAPARPHGARSPTAAQSQSAPAPQAQSVQVSARPELPGFMRDAPIPSFHRNIVDVEPTNIVSQISATPIMAIANPLLRRSFAALVSRPLGVRYMSTTHSVRFQPIRWSSPTATRPLGSQSRSFGSGGIPRSILANREAAANRNPDSATAQAVFYQLLLKANMPALVIERYQSGRFATNEAADEAYQKALTSLGGASGTFGQPPLPQAFQRNGDHLEPAGHLAPITDPKTIAALNAAAAAAASQQGRNVAIAQSPNKNGRIHVVVDETVWSVILRWFKFFAWFGLVTYVSMVFVTLVIDTVSMFQRKPGVAGAKKSEAKPEHQKARFSDVHGCDEAKEELQELVDFLKNPEKFNALGGKMPKGILLVGPPGTGKTLLARAVAGEAGVPFFFMSGSEFEEVYVGVGAQRVRELFAQAKAKSPSIVFIDELDAIGGKRSQRDAGYVRQTLNQLLTELDGFDQNSGVVFIAATNFPQSLDKALTRPGRFDRHVNVSLPDVRGRIAILKHHAKKIKIGGDINLDAIAARTPGLSGAELESIVNQAAVHASKIKALFVSQNDLEWAKDKVIMGAERKSMVITPKEKEMTAYHEAGHALVSYFGQDGPTNLYKVTVLPRGQTLGHTAYLPEMDKHSYTVRDYVALIDRAMGGKVAEEIVYGNELVTSGVSNDLDSATRIAWEMVAQLGMSEKLGPVEYLRRYEHLSTETRAMVEREVKRVLDESYSRARTLLISRRKELDLLAKALVEYETLDREEVGKVLRGEKLPGRTPVPPGPMMVPRRPETEQPGTPLPLPGHEPPLPPPPPPAAAATGTEAPKQ